MIFETYGIKYLGSKKTIAPRIGELAQSLGVKTAIDVFTGTTRVAQYFRQLGIKTYTSDLSWASECYSNTFVHNSNNQHLNSHICRMNDLPPKHGWLTKNYTGEVSQTSKKGTGRCWQLQNAAKADAARDYVERIRKDLDTWEYHTLITSIIIALDKVDNTVGVQQAYLKEWCARSYNPIMFELPPCIEGRTAKHFLGNALDLKYPDADMAYLDPPYSPHSYATYYHIWDSIARWDKPKTDLISKRRVDRVAKRLEYSKEMESDWNFRGKALEAFRLLIPRLPVKHVVISYNDESLIGKENLIEVCSEFDKHHKVEVQTIDYRRNIMSQIGMAAEGKESKDLPPKAQRNTEILIHIQRP